MKRLLNTLYITTEGASLRKDGDTVVVEIEAVTKTRVPLHMLGSIVVYGAVHLSPPLIQACAATGICIVLLDRIGRFQSRIEGPISGNVLLRKAQYVASDLAAPTGIEIVRSIIMGKLTNQRAVLMRSLRDHSSTMSSEACERVNRASSTIAALLKGPVARAATIDSLRGCEGEGAHAYFAVFNDLIRAPDPQIAFNGRSRRPPLDPVNAVLSFLYTLLTHDCRSAAEAVGLDPAVGFLHRDRPGRPSLALDLMEELRPALVDRMALSLFNRRQLRAHDFKTTDSGAVLMTDEARKTVLTAWQDRKRDERKHDFLNETAPLGLVPYLQALLLARHLRGDIDGYPPWFWS
ncbi:MAG: type I-C CRISPR-associated endonuclease Cas1c [Aquidulcibacter sp.]|jgi:CRISPR-associated protein Cas1|uniref:type I-C CRISPR-associated endonuclease Cas1c n=1 Tax=Aquidulcibacter sp. TaxID=2052990 RepID=UPI0022BF9F22|nr:type I-C CRISPR-associated endonuclease Cas1c [Aquidulcibacter sp.]